MSADPTLREGDVVAGRYVLEEHLGGGGMAFVFRARDTESGALCALKFMLPRLTRDEEYVRRFLAEAKIAMRIAHPNVVRVFGSAVDERTGLPFLSMEYLDGVTLQTFLRDHGPASWALARDLLAQLGAALEEAHRAGVVHRDLKPANIFLLEAQNPRLKVLDFGIAKLVDHTTTGTSTQVGTPGYCAPEQLGGGMRALAAERGIRVAREITPATDVWALGLIAFELFTGRRARSYWQADNVADLLVKIALGPREAPSACAGGAARLLPPGFDAWFLRCVDHDASLRFGSASEALAELLPRLESDQSSRLLGAVELTPQVSPRKRRWPLIALIAAVTIAAAGVVMLSLRRSEPATLESEPAAPPPASAAVALPAPPQPAVPALAPAPAVSPTTTTVVRAKPAARPKPTSPKPAPAASKEKSFDELFGNR